MAAASIQIAGRVRDAIEQHALLERPAECCGLLSGKTGVITELHRLRNNSPRPESRYCAAPEDLFPAMRRIREQGHQLIGIYHSHPRTPPYPSRSDVELAFYPAAIYFIVSLEPTVDLRAYRIVDGEIEGIEVRVC
jgi:proteasome lid subunit RPN8/RPN11